MTSRNTITSRHLVINDYLDDEYYTRYEDVDKELSLFDWRGKRILCPCDTNESAFVQWFQNHDIAVSTSTCFQECDFSIYDCVVTNPPFSWFNRGFLRQLATSRKFLIVVPVASLANKRFATLFINHIAQCDTRNNISEFMRPNRETAHVTSCWLTSLALPEKPFLELQEAEKRLEYYDGTRIVHRPHCKDVIDTKQLQGVPCTLPLYWNPRQFNIKSIITPSIHGHRLFTRYVVKLVKYDNDVCYTLF